MARKASAAFREIEAATLSGTRHRPKDRIRARVAWLGLTLSVALAFPAAAIAAETLTMQPAASAPGGGITSACAARELAVIALVEEEKLPSSRLGAIGLAQLDARLACLQGHETNALAGYDKILADNPSQTKSAR